MVITAFKRTANKWGNQWEKQTPYLGETKSLSGIVSSSVPLSMSDFRGHLLGCLDLHEGDSPVEAGCWPEKCCSTKLHVASWQQMNGADASSKDSAQDPRTSRTLYSVAEGLRREGCTTALAITLETLAPKEKPFNTLWALLNIKIWAYLRKNSFPFPKPALPFLPNYKSITTSTVLDVIIFFFFLTQSQSFMSFLPCTNIHTINISGAPTM